MSTYVTCPDCGRPRARTAGGNLWCEACGRGEIAGAGPRPDPDTVRDGIQRARAAIPRRDP